MQEILSTLQVGHRVLDLGSGPAGSFPANHTKATVIRIDSELHNPDLPNLAIADAAALPFPAACFEAAIANHTLEHFANLEGALAELKRVLKPNAMLYVAVPDASTLTDRIYRWLSKGGGHLNPFDDAERFSELVAMKTGRPHAMTRLLYSSFSFLNRCNSPVPRPRRLWLVGGGYEWSLKLTQVFFHAVDRTFGTRLRVYGWAFYFGPVNNVDRLPLPNMCVRCGSAHATSYLRQLAVAKPGLIGSFRCPQCGAKNLGLWISEQESI